MEKLLFILFLLFVSNCFADDVVCFDKDGNITQTIISVDLKNMGIISQDKEEWIRPDCIRCSREKVKSITLEEKVDVSKVDSNYFQDSKIVKRSKTELDAEKAAEQTKINAKQKLIDDTKAKLKELGFKDEEIAVIFSYRS